MMVICMLIVLLFLFSAVIKENTGIAYPIVFCVLLEPIKAKNPKITYADLYQVIWDA
jgi:hypothetical protein